MTEEKAQINCEVICDLMVVYASGEASEETVRFIETHLEDCPECREDYEAAKRGEDLLEELDPVERPIHIDGRKILLRFQRLVFGLVILALLIVILGIGVFERIFITQVLNIPLPQLYVLGGSGGGVEWILASLALVLFYGLFHFWRSSRAEDPTSPYLSLVGTSLLFAAGLTAYKFMVQGDLPGTLIAGMLTFAIYIFMLRWRASQHSDRFFGEFLLSLEAAVPLLFLILATLSLISGVSLTQGLPALIILLVALVFTLFQLGELPYFSMVTIFSLLTGGIMLLANAAGGFVNLLDLTPEWPSELGHPSRLEALDLDALGYSQLETVEIVQLNGVELSAGSRGIRTRYALRGGLPAYVAMLQFENQRDAGNFLRAWERRVDSGFYSIHLDLKDVAFDEPDGDAEHPLNWDLMLPAVWFGQEGQIVRSYNEVSLAAFNAWQVDEWITIVEVQGGVVQALPHTRMIKEFVAAVYK